MSEDQIIEGDPKSPDEAKQEPLDFLAIGHVTIDHVKGERQLGGAAAYASLTARRLGCRAGLITSAGPEFPFWSAFDGIGVSVVDADDSTELDQAYQDGRRRQRVRRVAATLRAEDCDRLPLADDAAVLYCPVVHELEMPLVRLKENGLCAVAPQGFFRHWNSAGVVSQREWAGAARALAGADVVCMSEEDTEVPETIAEGFPGRAFVITKGSAGSRIYSSSGTDVYDFPALPVEEIDPTGAGDVYAAAITIALQRGNPIHEAARFATREAAAAVETIGPEGLL